MNFHFSFWMVINLMFNHIFFLNFAHKWCKMCFNWWWYKSEKTQIKCRHYIIFETKDKKEPNRPWSIRFFFNLFIGLGLENEVIIFFYCFFLRVVVIDVCVCVCFFFWFLFCFLFFHRLMSKQIIDKDLGREKTEKNLNWSRRN
jgi:hypothetical protein